MLTLISDFFIRHAKGWIILLAFLAMAVCKLVLFPYMSALMNSATPGVGSFDTKLFYGPDQAYSMLEAYGQDARRAYMVGELTVDILFPIAYTLFLTLSISWLLQRAFDKEGSIQLLNLVPLGAWFFDLLENTGIVIMLAMFPAFSTLVAILTSFFSAIKWGFALVSIITLLFGFVAYIAKRIRG